MVQRQGEMMDGASVTASQQVFVSQAAAGYRSVPAIGRARWWARRASLPWDGGKVKTEFAITWGVRSPFRRVTLGLILVATWGWVVNDGHHAGAQEWRLLQPNHQARITSPVLTLHAIIKKPVARTGKLTVSQEAIHGGQVREFKVGGLEQEHVTIDGFDSPMMPGIYHLELTDDLRPNEILTRVSIEIIAAPEDGVDFPTIDTPPLGSWFPSDVAFIRLAGITHDRIWVSIRSMTGGRRRVTFPVDPQVGSIQWVADYRWDLGSGEFQVDIYTADPAWFEQESEAMTRFRVLEKPRSTLHPSLIQVEVR